MCGCGSIGIFGPTQLPMGGIRQRLSLQRLGVVVLATIGTCLAHRRPGIGLEELAPCVGTKASVDDALREVKALPEASRHLWDAEVALLFFLRRGSFLKANWTERGVILKGEPLAELCRWTSFVAGALPTANARRDVGRIAAFACGSQVAGRGELDQVSWLAALEGVGIDKVPAQAGTKAACFLVECKTITCGLWSLFHYLTLAGDRVRRSSSLLLSTGRPAGAPEDALFRIRGWVANFFGCQECVTHFTHMYDSGKHGRKELQPRDGAGRALWLWQVHNDVAHRVAGEMGLAAPPAWPEAADCPRCRRAGGGDWDRAEVLAHLRHTYVPAESGDGQ